MSASKHYQTVITALIEGIQDHGPMTTPEALAFLAGYGITLNPDTAPQYLRQAVHASTRILGVKTNRGVVYTLNDDPKPQET